MACCRRRAASNEARARCDLRGRGAICAAAEFVVSVRTPLRCCLRTPLPYVIV